jgi:CubicO group peptidase (beta-lactamase class C family)
MVHDAATYPGKDWEHISSAEAGFDPEKLDQAREWLDDEAGDTAYRVVIVRGGRIVAEWNRGLDRDQRLSMYSASKSVFSSVLGIAIDEGRISSADARLTDYYPEAMDVPEGEGPKNGRYAFDKDRAITLRQLISNTSGYMKPGEEPGRVFHYQTYGMNVLVHAISKTYGNYDIGDAENSPDLRPLLDQRIGGPIGASFTISRENFDLHAGARIHIFGYANWINATALDMARLGWLWRNWGRWEHKRVIPEAWLREAVKTAPTLLANSPKEEWKYGLGFWTNDHGEHFPSLPRDVYAAQGAQRQQILVCPSRDLVLVQSPGVYDSNPDNETGLLKRVFEADRS